MHTINKMIISIPEYVNVTHYWVLNGLITYYRSSDGVWFLSRDGVIWHPVKIPIAQFLNKK